MNLSLEREIRVLAPAKINLTLQILGKRDDGYHEIRSRMLSISLADELILSSNDPALDLDPLELVFHCDEPNLPSDAQNLVVRAWKAFQEATQQDFPPQITLKKKIPHGAGLGGGSSDAAATLKALNAWYGSPLGTETLKKIGAQIGSDVPFFIEGGAAEVSGRGEIVENIPFLYRLELALFKPEFGVSTPDAYRHWGKSQELVDLGIVPQKTPWGLIQNDLENPVFHKFPLLSVAKRWLLRQPETLAALMSGSGSTLFSVTRSHQDSIKLITRFHEQFGNLWWSESAHTHLSSLLI